MLPSLSSNFHRFAPFASLFLPSFPSELISHILTFLPPEMLSFTSLVSRKWCVISKNVATSQQKSILKKGVEQFVRTTIHQLMPEIDKELILSLQALNTQISEELENSFDSSRNATCFVLKTIILQINQLLIEKPHLSNALGTAIDLIIPRYYTVDSELSEFLKFAPEDYLSLLLALSESTFLGDWQQLDALETLCKMNQADWILLIAQETVDEKLRNLSILAISRACIIPMSTSHLNHPSLMIWKTREEIEAVMTFAHTLPEFTQVGTMMAIQVYPLKSMFLNCLGLHLLQLEESKKAQDIFKNIFDEKCQSIFIESMADSLFNKQKIDEAINCLMTIPNESIRCSALDIRLRRFLSENGLHLLSRIRKGEIPLEQFMHPVLILLLVTRTFPSVLAPLFIFLVEHFLEEALEYLSKVTNSLEKDLFYQGLCIAFSNLGFKSRAKKKILPLIKNERIKTEIAQELNSTCLIS